MTLTQEIITISMCVLATVSTRALPFILFSSKRPTPKYIQYLGKALPGAVFAMLIVYCLKGVDVTQGSHGIPEAIAIAVNVVVHLIKRHMLISMAVGTACYMVLVQFIFQIRFLDAQFYEKLQIR